MSVVIPEPAWQDVYNNLLASFLWLLIVLLFTYLVRRPLLRVVRIVKPKLSSKIPHVNADIMSRRVEDNWVTDVKLKNSGKEPAYNIYLYLFERYAEGSYTIKNLGKEEIKAGVLGSGEAQIFTDKEVMFDGCNVTSDQEIWIDYDNASGSSFRVILHPPTPRGDDWSVEPPRILKKRLLNIPYMAYSGNDKQWRDIREGKAGGVKLLQSYDKSRAGDSERG